MRSLQRRSYVEYQAGNVADAQRHANEAARLAHRLGAWFHFICAQSILYAAAVNMRDDHAAALWHAQQIVGPQSAPEIGAIERTHSARNTSSRLSAGHSERALAIESAMPLHSGFRDELECCVALATRLTWNGEFSEGYRILADAGRPRGRSFRTALLECSARDVRGVRRRRKERIASPPRVWPGCGISRPRKRHRKRAGRLLRSDRADRARHIRKPPSAVCRITLPLRRRARWHRSRAI